MSPGPNAGGSTIKGQWTQTLAIADSLDPALLSRQVDHEWSFVQTVRHLVFVTDAWISRTVQGAAQPFWPAGQPATDLPVWYREACGIDPKALPTYDEVLTARAERIAVLDQIVTDLTGDDLDRRCSGNRTPGYPTDPRKYTIGHCVRTVLSEEWAHHSFAARDLSRL